MISPRLTTFVIAIALLSAIMINADAKSHPPLTEEAATDLLWSTIKRDHVYDKRISLDCITIGTADATRIYFEFVLRENHTARCGGDRNFTPVLDRYRVHRASGKIELYDAAADNWQPYRGTATPR